MQVHKNYCNILHDFVLIFLFLHSLHGPSTFLLNQKLLENCVIFLVHTSDLINKSWYLLIYTVDRRACTCRTYMYCLYKFLTFNHLSIHCHKVDAVLTDILVSRQLYMYSVFVPRGGGGVLPYMGYIGMCGPKGYGFSAVLVINRVSIIAILPPLWS